MVVDFARSVAAESVMIDQAGELTRRLRYYRAADGAKALPFMHAFGLRHWAKLRLPEPTGPRVLAGPRDWRPNAYPFPGPGDHWHGPVEWFRDGIPVTEVLDPTGALDPACEPPMLNVRYTDDSLIISDVAELDIDRNRGLTLSADLGAGIAHLGTVDADQTHVGMVSLTDQYLGQGVKGVEYLVAAAGNLTEAAMLDLGIRAYIAGSLMVDTPAGPNVGYAVMGPVGGMMEARRTDLAPEEWIGRIEANEDTSPHGLRLSWRQHGGDALPLVTLTITRQAGRAILSLGGHPDDTLPPQVYAGGVLVGGDPAQQLFFSGYRGP